MRGSTGEKDGERQGTERGCRPRGTGPIPQRSRPALRDAECPAGGRRSCPACAGAIRAKQRSKNKQPEESGRPDGSRGAGENLKHLTQRGGGRRPQPGHGRSPTSPDLPTACGGPARPGPHTAGRQPCPTPARRAGGCARSLPAPGTHIAAPPAAAPPLRSAPQPCAPLRSPRRRARMGRRRQREGARRREPGGLKPRFPPRPSPPPALARSSSLAPEEASAQREPPGQGEGAPAAR